MKSGASVGETVDQLDLFSDDADGLVRATIRFGTVTLPNRKYLGSKQRLLDFIESNVIENQRPPYGLFVDGFAGTGVVADRFRRHCTELVLVDNLYSNYVVNSAFFESTPSNVNINHVAATLEILNALSPKKGYAYENYGGTYFTLENAGLIDTIRDEIELKFGDGLLTNQEKKVLLASLLFAADKVANTVGQYDAFLKNLGSSSYSESGRHVVDSNVYKRITLRLPRLDLSDRPARVLHTDLNSVVGSFQADVLYLDPPYSSRQYIDCYHVLENIARWDKPPLLGKTRKFERNDLKSGYSKRGEVARTFSDLISKSSAKLIVISYNNEGIMSFEQIEAVLNETGDSKYVDADYTVFGNGAGQSKKRSIIERLYLFRPRNVR